MLQPLALFNPKASQTSLEQLLEESQVARTRVYSSLGSLQSFTLTEAQTLVGAPRWPAQRQTFQVIRRPGGTVLLVSDGLSDPFDDLQADANVNGYGLEFFIETPDAELGSSPAEVKASWQFQLLYTVCSLAAGHGGIKSIIDDLGLL